MSVDVGLFVCLLNCAVLSLRLFILFSALSFCIVFLYCVCVSGVGVRLKVGGDKIEKSEGVGLGRGCSLLSWGSRGFPPEKKNQFCAKNYAILNKFWYFDICYITA